jgi:hypothetical protein
MTARRVSHTNRVAAKMSALSLRNQVQNRGRGTATLAGDLVSHP